VTSNRVLAAAYAGAPRFGVEVFEPDTANTLMAALLVRDLRDPGASGAPTSQLRHPSELFVESAVHSGLWRNAFQPRSVLPLAAVLGLPRVRALTAVAPARCMAAALRCDAVAVGPPHPCGVVG
jgi:hypothetical protein